MLHEIFEYQDLKDVNRFFKQNVKLSDSIQMESRQTNRKLKIFKLTYNKAITTILHQRIK